MADDCIFCKILAGEIPSEKVYQDESIYAFKDINPVAPHHVLIIPRQHLAGVNDVAKDDEKLLGHLFTVAKTIARDLDVDGPGFRLVVNTNREAGQEVFHLHLHLLAGRKLGPMG